MKEVLLITVWVMTMKNRYEFSAKETKLITLRHDLVAALSDKLSREQRQTVANELELILERF